MPVHCSFPVYSLIFPVTLPQENPSVNLNDLPAEKKREVISGQFLYLVYESPPVDLKIPSILRLFEPRRKITSL